MPKRNLFKKLNHPSSDIPLRPFDLSQRKVYSSRAGMCVPELCMEVVKGDKFKIDTTVFNRTDKLLAPAYFRCKQFHHFFFVPYHTLWHEWDSFITRSTEKLSSATLGSNYFPNFDLLGFLDSMDSDSNSHNDMMGYRDLPGIDRMLEMLHYGSWDSYEPQSYTTAGSPQKYCNLARILAYNKIWYWYYRDKRHNPASAGAFPFLGSFEKLYNVDDVDSSTFASSHIDHTLNTSGYSRLLAMFAPKYRTWDSDVFTNSFVDTQFGSVSVLNAENVQIFNSVSKASIGGIAAVNATNVAMQAQSSQDYPYMTLKDTGGTVISGSSRWNIPSLFDILQLRKAEAVQHWRELMLRAGDSSGKRYIAMFGSAPNRSEEAPNLIGGFDVNLNIDDVTATAYDSTQAQGDNNGLGQLAGKGIMSQNGQTIEFTAPDFGIIMCISSIMPLAEYDGNCIDKANMLVEPTDFYIPQYDRLGFEPVIRAEQLTDYQALGSNYWEKVIGYTVRNHYLKTAVDRVYNNFRTGKSEAYWSCTRRNLYGINPIINSVYDFRNYYINPSVINNLFDRHCNPVTSSPDSAYNEDQFKCLTYFNITALRPMSELGLPPL